MADSFSREFKRSFGRGLAILLPTIVTLWILWQAFSFVYTNVAEPINRGTRIAVIRAAPYVFPVIYSDFEEVGRGYPQTDPTPDPDAAGLQGEDSSSRRRGLRTPDWYIITAEDILQARSTGRFRPNTAEQTIIRELRREQFRRAWNKYPYLNLSGFVIAILLIYLAGVLLSNFFGRTFYQRVERLIAAVPGFKQVYPHVKQVVDLILGEKKMAFSKVVLVEYPSPGIWTIGFLTGDSLRAIDVPAGGAVVSVFIPTSPTPFTGFTINVLAEKAIVVEVSVEEALRFVITAGVLTPETANLVGTVSGGPKTIPASNAEEAAAKARAGVARANAGVGGGVGAGGPDRTTSDRTTSGPASADRNGADRIEADRTSPGA